MKLDKNIGAFIRQDELASCFGTKAGLVGEFSVQQMFGWNDLNEVLSSSRLSPPRLRFAHQDMPSEELDSFFTETVARRGVSVPHIQAEHFTNLLNRGATLVLDAVDEFDPRLRTLVRGFARTFTSIPQVNLYACFGDAPGFGLHWDDHDVFIFQVEGRKHWKVYEPTREAPCYRDFEPPTTPPDDAEPYFEKVLEAGEVLYVPRGHWHDVLGMNEPSLHLTLGITHPTATELLSWLADDLKEAVEARRDIPLFDKEAQSKWNEDVFELITRRFDGNLAAEYLERRLSLLQPKYEPSLPYSLKGHFPDECKITWSTVVPAKQHDDGSVTLTAYGVETTFSPVVREVAEIIQSARKIDKGSLRDRVAEIGHEDKLDKILNLLINKGIVSVSGDQ